MSLVSIAELRSTPRSDGASGVELQQELEGDVTVWRWTCPHCDRQGTEPGSTPRQLIADDPACLLCRVEGLHMDLRSFVKAFRGRRLPMVTGPAKHWRSPRADLRDGCCTFGTRIEWDTAETWAAGFVELAGRRSTSVGYDKNLVTHVRALAAELEVLECAPLEDLEWVLDIVKRQRAPGPTTPIIDAIDRRLTRMRRVEGAGDGSRVYVVERPRGAHTFEPHSAPWEVYRKGRVGLVAVRADIAGARLAPLVKRTSRIHVRGWAEVIGFQPSRNGVGGRHVGQIQVASVLPRGAVRW